jgi:hypothetical protein
VAGIAAISLAVAGILVMNVMLVAVAQRTSEIGPEGHRRARRRHPPPVLRRGAVAVAGRRRASASGWGTPAVT